MKIKSFRSYEKGMLQGFFEVELPSGMCVRDLTLHNKDGSRWVGYPSKPYQDDEGNTKYQNQIYFPDKAVHHQFQERVLSALDAYFVSNQKDATGTDGIPF
jgi:hypothetical protein